LSGIIFVDRNGLRWRTRRGTMASQALRNRWKRWGAAGVFARIMEGLDGRRARCRRRNGRSVTGTTTLTGSGMRCGKRH